MRVKLHWQAVLEDGGLLSETDEGVRYRDIFDKDLRVAEFRVIDTYPWTTPDGKVLPPRLFMAIPLDPYRQRPVMRYRNEIQVDMGSGREKSRSRVMIVGWREREQDGWINLAFINESTGVVVLAARPLSQQDEIVMHDYETEAVPSG